MKILVTGAAGFIGGQLWHTLWKRGDEVVGIDNFSYGNPDNLKFDDHDFGAEVRRMDIRDKAGIRFPWSDLECTGCLRFPKLACLISYRS